VYSRIALEEYNRGRTDHARAALMRARETLRPLFDIADEMFGDLEKFQREQARLHVFKENEFLWTTALTFARARFMAAEALLEGFTVAAQTVAWMRLQQRLGLLETARVLGRAGRLDEAKAACVQALAASDHTQISEVISTEIECGFVDLAEETLARLGKDPIKRSDCLRQLAAAVAAQDCDRARVLFLQAVEAARAIPRGSEREGTLWRSAIAMAECGFGDLALQTARTTNRYRDDYLARLLKATAQAGDVDIFLHLLGDSLADGESSRQAALIVIDQYPQHVDAIASWVSSLN
jgi:hypothetical protein